MTFCAKSDIIIGMNQLSYTRATAKTRRKIQEAFAELLKERGATNNISVTDLAERAEITRGTFYNYYNNINEVRVELQNEIERHLFSEYKNLNTLEGIEKYIDDVFVFLEQQEVIYRELLATDAPTGFLVQLEKEITKSVFVTMKAIGVDYEAAELELLFLTNGTIAIVQKYYRGEVSLSLVEIRDYLKNKLRWMLKKYQK